MFTEVCVLVTVLVVVREILKRLYPEPLRWEWDNCGDGEFTKREAIDTDDIDFPSNFLWGTATAAHQVEGDCTNNQWWQWEHSVDNKGQPRIKHAQKSGRACEHWQRFGDDVQLMRQLHCNSYRFSLEWSKLEPSKGRFDRAAIEHYHQVLDALEAAGIAPMVTLHHFSHPLWFDELGGWESESALMHFEEFSEAVFREFGSRVRYWCTINEPEVFVTSGYFSGVFPPGKKNPALAGRVLRNLLEAHVRVYYRLKQLPYGARAQIGIVKDIFQFEPWTPYNPLDRFIAGQLDNCFNGCILEFFRTGRFHFRLFPGVDVQHVNARAPAANDFIGLNYYSHYHVRFVLDPKQPFRTCHREGDLATDMPYPMYPEGIFRALKAVGALGKPVYVTENGIADRRDDRRALFLRRYLYAISRAIRDGVDVRGYFYWSLMDNFEWVEGYEMRFGLYAVDFKTQQRTLRDGSKYFQQVCQKFARPIHH